MRIRIEMWVQKLDSSSMCVHCKANIMKSLSIFFRNCVKRVKMIYRRYGKCIFDRFILSYSVSWSRSDFWILTLLRPLNINCDMTDDSYGLVICKCISISYKLGWYEWGIKIQVQSIFASRSFLKMWLKFFTYACD